MKRHPTDLLLEAFLLDQSDERREILLHLCECERCRERLRSRTPRHPAGLPGPDPEPPPPLPGNLRVLGLPSSRPRALRGFSEIQRVNPESANAPARRSSIPERSAHSLR